MKLIPSIEKGFYFQCVQCGNCCSENTEGYIFIFPTDVDHLEKALHIPKKDIAERYFSILTYEFRIWTKDLEYTGRKEAMDTLVFRADLKDQCFFLQQKNHQKLCGIYENRPTQCRTFPLWSLTMTTEEHLQEAMKNCKGIILLKDKQRLVDIGYVEKLLITPEQIEMNVRLDRKMEYNYYQLMKTHNFDITSVYPFLREVKIPRNPVTME